MALEATYAARAIPAGSDRYFAHLFGSREARAPLLGVFALQAEWQALLDPATESGVAQVKLAWWQEEVRRLAAGQGVHPISRYLRSLPGAAAADYAHLQAGLEAALAESSGVPLERAAELPAHAMNLCGRPLLFVAQFASSETAGLSECLQALAVAEYRHEALAHYRRYAAAGRVSFAVDELLALGIDNAALAQPRAAPALHAYVDTQRSQARASYARALAMLRGRWRETQRHLLVLAGLGSRRLEAGAGGGFSRLWWAWRLARSRQRDPEQA